MFQRRDRRVAVLVDREKKSASLRSLIVIFPEPARIRTRATEVLRRPVPNASTHFVAVAAGMNTSLRENRFGSNDTSHQRPVCPRSGRFWGIEPAYTIRYAGFPKLAEADATIADGSARPARSAGSLGRDHGETRVAAKWCAWLQNEGLFCSMRFANCPAIHEVFFDDRCEMTPFCSTKTGSLGPAGLRRPPTRSDWPPPPQRLQSKVLRTTQLVLFSLNPDFRHGGSST